MKFHEDESMAVARKVLAAMKHEAEERVSAREVVVKAYANGREQGFHLTAYPENGLLRGVSFAQSRGSDEIVVYFGVGASAFDGHGVPSEAVYQRGRRFYGHEYVMKAAREAVTFLMQ